MAKVERIREVLSGPLSPEYLKYQADAGWRLAAVEWERVVEAEPQSTAQLKRDVPFGLRVADDCLHLLEDPTEQQILLLMMELIVQDLPLSKVAEELNRQSFRTRDGFQWSQISVFNLLPRLVEAGPHILSSQQWTARRQHLFPAL